METPPTPYEALCEALEIAGSQSELARIAGVSQTAVWKWIQTSKRVSHTCVLRIEDATGVSRHFLRPDIYPASLEVTDEVYNLSQAQRLDRRVDPVVCDHPAKAQRKDVA
ncbi:transcriptional regulator [Novosphingobium resinovorum]|uniref:transcriptional regulator n=1 Tax=Novosphingobium resinovorum TaxID=158500 RepID=UPI002ED491E4|nr:YdaS family helix-turn-helix protein [Novosphingobium resinovorum]